MNTQYWMMVGKRFLKMFLIGGVASLGAVLATDLTSGIPSDMKVWAFSLGMAFLTGGIAAIEKGLQGWNP